MTTHLEVPEWRGEIAVPEIKVYVSGPMRGIPRFNFPMFDRARDWLTKMGYTVFSPADNDRETYPGIEDWPGFAEGQLAPGFHFDLHKAMAWDLARCAEVDALVLLPGWEQSKGAAHEVYVARVCGKRLYEFHPGAVYDEMTELMPPRIIGLSGYARAGKDTAGEALVSRGWVRVSFADALKQVLYDLRPLFDLDGHFSSDTCGDIAQNVDALGWEQVKAGEDTGYSAREYLQRLGTAVREHVSPTAWVDAAFRNMRPGGRYVITDLRYPNEYEAVKEQGGQVWRITRPGFGPANDHVSEVALDGHHFDHYIVNDQDVSRLQAKVADLALHAS